MTGSFYNAMHTCPIKLNGGNNQARVSLIYSIPIQECQEPLHLGRVATILHIGRYQGLGTRAGFCPLILCPRHAQFALEVKTYKITC